MVVKSKFSVFILRMQSASLALEELLVTAQKEDCLTVGIYESAKLLNAWVETILFGSIVLSHACLLNTHSWENTWPNLTAPGTWVQVLFFFSLFPNLDFPRLSEILTAWFCASWLRTARMTWPCRSTSRCSSPSAATRASTSCGSPGSSGSGSFWVVQTQTETRRRAETSTACWWRWVGRTRLSELVVFLFVCFFSRLQIKLPFLTSDRLFSAEPAGGPLQAARSGDLLPGESPSSPVGAGTGPARTLNKPRCFPEFRH